MIAKHLKVSRISLFESGHAMITHKGESDTDQFIDLYAPSEEALSLLINSLKVKVDSASEKAVEKIKEKGGEVILPK